MCLWRLNDDVIEKKKFFFAGVVAMITFVYEWTRTHSASSAESEHFISLEIYSFSIYVHVITKNCWKDLRLKRSSNHNSKLLVCVCLMEERFQVYFAIGCWCTTPFAIKPILDNEMYADGRVISCVLWKIRHSVLYEWIKRHKLVYPNELATFSLSYSLSSRLFMCSMRAFGNRTGASLIPEKISSFYFFSSAVIVIFDLIRVSIEE